MRKVKVSERFKRFQLAVSGSFALKNGQKRRKMCPVCGGSVMVERARGMSARDLVIIGRGGIAQKFMKSPRVWGG